MTSSPTAARPAGRGDACGGRRPRCRGVRWCAPALVAVTTHGLNGTRVGCAGPTLLGVDAPAFGGAVPPGSGSPAEAAGDRASALAERAAYPSRSAGPGTTSSPTSTPRSRGKWRLQGRELEPGQPRQGLLPGAPGERPLTRRDPHPLPRRHGAGHAPYLADRRQPPPLPRRRRQPASGTRWPRATRRPGSAAGATRRPTPGSQGATSWSTARPGAGLDGQLRRRRAAPWTSLRERRRRPTWALIDIDPGAGTSFDEVRRCWRPPLPDRARPPRRDRWPQGHRPAGASRSGSRSERRLQLRRHRAWVERLSRAVGATVPELVSWAWRQASHRTGWPASTTRRTP